MTSITQFMSEDHDRLDAIFVEFQKKTGRSKDLFSQFEAGLRAHIKWEEEYLFPPFEERSGMRDSGPTAVMRIEHRQIKECLEQIGQNIEQGSIDEPSQRLLDVLEGHNHKEEQILYPMIDRMLVDDEKKAILDRIKEAL